jgi:hypothetical protein
MLVPLPPCCDNAAAASQPSRLALTAALRYSAMQKPAQLAHHAAVAPHNSAAQRETPTAGTRQGTDRAGETFRYTQRTQIDEMGLGAKESKG